MRILAAFLSAVSGAFGRHALRIGSAPTRVALTVALLVGSSTVTAQPADRLSLTLTGSTLRVEGVTPGHAAIVFGIGREEVQYEKQRLSWTIRVADDDRDGVVTYDLGRRIPERSVWTVADERTGRVASAAPLARTAPLQPLHPRSIARGDGRRPDRIVSGRSFIHVLWIRPGAGAWVASGGDGGASDDDGAVDGKVELAPGRFRAIRENPPPPQSFRPRDVFIVADPSALHLLSGEVPQ